MNHTSHTRAVRFLSGLFYFFSVFIFINAFNFQHNPPSGWYKQILPQNLPPLNDLTFQDSLTGYAITLQDADSIGYVIKTTNGGDNWIYILEEPQGRTFTDIEFLNAATGFVCTQWNRGTSRLYKTSNGGDTWELLNNPPTLFTYDDLCVLNESEIWAANDLGLEGGVFRSTDGAVTWQNRYYELGRQPDRIHMINSRIGFISDGDNVTSWLRKTTDAGESWTEIPNGDGWYNIFFQDSLVGWRTLFDDERNFQKTTDGGLSWSTLLEYSAGNPVVYVLSYSIVGEGTIWGSSYEAFIRYPGNKRRGVIFRTTNAGFNWGYQLPDTSFGWTHFKFCQFAGPKIGWAYVGVHTLTGGDTVTYPLTSVGSQGSEIPPDFRLYQNYPNPFNPTTIIEYELQSPNKVMLKVCDSGGREVRILVNSRQHSGKHKVEFNGRGLSSGVYFYILYLGGSEVQSRKMVLLR
ncbi:MAG: T9SS type A sorting domain-containing protein [Ignavibacteria bacterium]|nr:T9SS type A sorting domain-containing protein [Ignavibacteria bacterium]